jgi:hypothetical protein
LNIVVIFLKLSDRQNPLAVKIQCRQDLAVDVFPVSPSLFLSHR